jgi:hypothetical protein
MSLPPSQSHDAASRRPRPPVPTPLLPGSRRQPPPRWRRGLSLVLPLLLLGAPGCGPVEPPRTAPTLFETQEEAGVIHIGVQSVAAFEDYIDALQPRFTLTADEALRRAVPVTETQELRAAVSTVVQAAVALATVEREQLASASEVTSRSGAGEEKQEGRRERSSRTARRSGAVPEAPDVELPEDLLARLEQLSATPDLDPSLQYRAAAALLQDLALLSSYVREAAVGRDTLPFIVRLLVTVYPSATREPYDVYSTISFFNEGLRVQPFNVETASDPNDSLFTFGSDVTARLGASPSGEGFTSRCDGGAMAVIPLFVTDSVESTLLKSSRTTDREIGGSLAGSVGTAGVGLSGGQASSAGAAVASRDVRGSFTLGRAAENAIALRIGAPHVDGVQQLAPRTYNVTALALLPAPSGAALRGATGIGLPPDYEWMTEEQFLLCTGGRFVAQTQMRDARTGQALPRTTHQGLVATVGADLGLPAGDLRPQAAVDAAIRGDFDRFRKAIEPQDASIFWPGAVSRVARSGLAGGSFEVPIRVFRFFSDDQQVALLDDGKKSWVQLSGAVGLTTVGLAGRLSAQTAAGTVWLDSTSATVSDDGRRARVEFPSVKSLVGPTVANVGVVLAYQPPTYRWRSANAPRWSARIPTAPVVTTRPPDPPAAEFSVRATTATLGLDCAGEGTLLLEVRAAPQKRYDVRLALDGARLLGAPSGGRFDGADLVLPTDGLYPLELADLAVGVPVVVRSWRLLDGARVAGADVTAVPVTLRCPAPSRSASGAPGDER